MTTTDLTTTGPTATALSIAAEQTAFTEQQVATLSHLGVEGASEGDLGVFFHVVKRTGLDPFARQIYMIGRRGKDANDQWVTKWTIQTGIDGYRLIARRAADRAREPYAVDPIEWAHEDGSWRLVWRQAWGHPVAARCTVIRGGQRFTATALFDEYAQTTRNGSLTSMWSQRPAGQIAKCAEALALRMAFPQDLAGVYVEDELHAADARAATEREDRPTVQRLTAADLEAEVVHDAEVVDEPASPASTAEEPPCTRAQRDRIGRALKAAALGDDRDAALRFYTEVAERPITATTDLTVDEADRVLAELQAITNPGGAS